MGCNCCGCPNLIAATGITASTGVTVITLPEGTTFSNGQCYCIGLFLDVPAGTNGNQINISVGGTTYTVFNKVANLWRPKCALRGRSVLRLRFFNDPNHFLKV